MTEFRSARQPQRDPHPRRAHVPAPRLPASDRSTGSRAPRFVKLATLTLGLTAGVGTAGANIVGTTGDILQTAPPASVVLGATTSNTVLFAFNENPTACVTLAADLLTDGGVIFAGTRIKSHFFHSDFDSPGAPLGGRVRFDADILGVISTTMRLDRSDALSATATTYPTGLEPDRGLEAVPTDAYTVVAPRVIELQMDVTTFSDQVRVVTACP